MLCLHSRRRNLEFGGFMIGALNSVGFIELAGNEAGAGLESRQIVSTQLVRPSPNPHREKGNGG